MKNIPKRWVKFPLSVMMILLTEINSFAQRGVPLDIKHPEDKVPFHPTFYFIAGIGLILYFVSKNVDEKSKVYMPLRVAGILMVAPVVLHFISEILGEIESIIN